MPSSFFMRRLLVLAASALTLSACTSPSYTTYGAPRYDPNTGGTNYGNSYSPVERVDPNTGASYSTQVAPASRSYDSGNSLVIHQDQPVNTAWSDPNLGSRANPSGGCVRLGTSANSGGWTNSDNRAAALLNGSSSVGERSDSLLDALTQSLTGLPQARQLRLQVQDDGAVLLRVPSSVLLADTRLIHEDFLDVIDRVAATVARYCEVDVHVAGHTDSIGDAEYNQSLSISRARKVKELLTDALLRLGVRDRRLTFEGLGSSQPVASNATSAGRALNRRVEIFLVPPP